MARQMEGRMRAFTWMAPGSAPMQESRPLIRTPKGSVGLLWMNRMGDMRFGWGPGALRNPYRIVFLWLGNVGMLW